MRDAHPVDHAMDFVRGRGQIDAEICSHGGVRLSRARLKRVTDVRLTFLIVSTLNL